MSLRERLAVDEFVPAPEVTGPGADRAVLDEVEKRIHYRVIDELGGDISSALGDAALRQRLERMLGQMLDVEEVPLSAEDRLQITADVIDNVVGYGPIQPLLDDPTITEVMVNHSSSIYIERGGRLFRTKRRFIDEAHLMRIIDKIVSNVGRRIDETSPMVDARLPDGSRVNAVIGPLAINGPMLTIRKFSKDPYTVDDLIAFGTMDEKTAQFVDACVRGKLNILISGGTGSGKTTLLNVVSGFVPADERVITIEDAAELRLAQEHVLRLESRPPNIEGSGQVTIRDLVRNSLRMRPDRIIVGEVRGGEALDMLQAMNTGHDGSLSTIHANSARDALSRLETMVLMAGYDLPVRAIREQQAAALDMIVHLVRLRDGSRRVEKICEVEAMEGDVIVLQDLFYFDYSAGVDDDGRFLGTLKATGVRPKLSRRLEDLGIRLPNDIFEYQAPVRR
jgi:pilus assembly protein CpaF